MPTLVPTLRARLLVLAAVCAASISGCSLFANKSTTPDEAAKGDPNCVADGSFEADFYGCTGTPGSPTGAQQPSAPPASAPPASEG